MPSSMRPITTTSGVRGRQRDVAEGGQPKGEGDRHGGEHHHPDQADEEDQKVEVAERLQHGAQQDKHADNGRDQRDGAGHVPPVADAEPAARGQRPS